MNCRVVDFNSVCTMYIYVHTRICIWVYVCLLVHLIKTDEKNKLNRLSTPRRLLWICFPFARVFRQTIKSEFITWWQIMIIMMLMFICHVLVHPHSSPLSLFPIISFLCYKWRSDLGLVLPICTCALIKSQAKVK